MGIIVDVLRSVLFWLDSAIYSIIGSIYNLMTDIAETTIVSEELIDKFGSRIYTLLGIFMLFKVSFSIINYIVNPDDFLDKSKGFHKLVSNIIISLVLLVITPWVFDKAFEVQRIILRDNVISKIIIGPSGSTSSSVASTNPGKTMGYQTFRAFYYLDENNYPSCAGIYTTGLDESDITACANEAFDSENGNAFVDTITFSAQASSVSMYTSFDLANAKDKSGNYTMTYTPIISTLTGVVVVLLLISFCFDIAVRSIQLGFLQLIAPVPIISRVDPKSSKDGMFSKWFKNCTKTYLDLFVRLAAIYFAVFIIGSISLTNQYNSVTGEIAVVNPLVKVFIILGALIFAKKLPQLISDITGFKIDAKFALNPFKKMSEIPVVGAGAALAVGVADSAIHGNGLIAGVKRNWGKVPLTGGDGKTSILDTADRKLRKDINQKADLARSRYEGLNRQRLLEEQKQIGEKYGADTAEARAAYQRDTSAEFRASKEAVDKAKGEMYNWQNYVTRAQSNYQAIASQYGTNSAQAQEAYKILQDANQNSGKAQGQYEYLKKLHETVRQQDQQSARIEDAIEAWEKAGGGKHVTTVSEYEGKLQQAATPQFSGSPMTESQQQQFDAFVRDVENRASGQ